MWARVVEFMLACWLAVSPFIFGYPDESTFFWVNDLACSFAVAIFALLSFYRPLRKMHLCSLLVIGWLIGVSYFFRSIPFQAPLQNYMTLALLLLMIVIIPSEASKPPLPWRNFYKNRR